LAFIVPPDEMAVEVVRMPLAVAQSGTGSMETEEVALAFHPQNPSAAIPVTVRLLAQLHPDIILGFRVNSQYLVILDAIRKKFISRSSHIPLNLLTNTACADSGADTSSSMTEFLCLDQTTGQLV
jgi:hypothetical protein